MPLNTVAITDLQGIVLTQLRWGWKIL